MGRSILVTSFYPCKPDDKSCALNASSMCVSFRLFNTLCIYRGSLCPPFLPVSRFFPTTGMLPRHNLVHLEGDDIGHQSQNYSWSSRPTDQQVVFLPLVTATQNPYTFPLPRCTQQMHPDSAGVLQIKHVHRVQILMTEQEGIWHV